MVSFDGQNGEFYYGRLEKKKIYKLPHSLNLTLFLLLLLRAINTIQESKCVD